MLLLLLTRYVLDNLSVLHGGSHLDVSFAADWLPVRDTVGRGCFGFWVWKKWAWMLMRRCLLFILDNNQSMTVYMKLIRKGEGRNTDR